MGKRTVEDVYNTIDKMNKSIVKKGRLRDTEPEAFDDLENFMCRAQMAYFSAQIEHLIRKHARHCNPPNEWLLKNVLNENAKSSRVLDCKEGNDDDYPCDIPARWNVRLGEHVKFNLGDTEVDVYMKMPEMKGWIVLDEREVMWASELGLRTAEWEATDPATVMPFGRGLIPDDDDGKAKFIVCVVNELFRCHAL